MRITAFLSPKKRLMGISGFRLAHPGWTIKEHDKDQFGNEYPVVVAAVYDPAVTTLHLHYLNQAEFKQTASYL